MAKAQSDTPHAATQEAAVPTHAYRRTPQTDTKTVVIAVGSALVLFIVGLILGYLLGHQTATTDNRGYMNNDSSMYDNNNSLRGRTFDGTSSEN